MADRKLIDTGLINGSYGTDRVKLEKLVRGKHAGKFITRGAGFAGRIAYSSEERARGAVQSHAHFQGWEG